MRPSRCPSCRGHVRGRMAVGASREPQATKKDDLALCPSDYSSRRGLSHSQSTHHSATMLKNPALHPWSIRVPANYLRQWPRPSRVTTVSVIASALLSASATVAPQPPLGNYLALTALAFAKQQSTSRIDRAAVQRAPDRRHRSTPRAAARKRDAGVPGFPGRLPKSPSRPAATPPPREAWPIRTPPGPFDFRALAAA